MPKNLAKNPSFFYFLKNISNILFLKNLVFLRFMLVLNGLKSSGRPVGTISTYFRQKRSGGFRAMTKKPKKLKTKKVNDYFNVSVLPHIPS